MFIKVCGITRAEDAETAFLLGYDAVGMIFAESPRRLEPDAARTICRAMPPALLRVGVFVNAGKDEVRRVMEYCGLDLLQFHGDESPEEVAPFGRRAIKAIRLRGSGDLDLLEEYTRAYAVLLDAWDPSLRGGTGRSCDWGLAAKAAAKARIILAGGLDPTNVARAVREVRPFGIDVSSGVESSVGVKDHDLLRDFARQARAGGRTPFKGEEDIHVDA
jgi:phosphoribosylanthranilate isomerase